MQRRLLAAVAAFLIAVVGAVVLVGYARSADARAQAGEQQVTVLVVGTRVPAGTAAAAIAGSVRTEQVPARLAVPGSMTDLSGVTGRVTTADLLPGEQVVRGRFADPASLLPAGTVAAPAGTQEVSLTLQPQQAVNGALVGGDRVGVLVLGTDGSGKPAAQLDGVLVTRSTGAPKAGDPGAQVTVTLALDPSQSATVVTGMQRGTVWLSLQASARPGTTSPSTATTPSAGAQS